MTGTGLVSRRILGNPSNRLSRVACGMANSGIDEASDCVGDLNDDGIVNGADLSHVLGALGMCP